MGFKTSQWPCVEVLRSSGEPCLQFQEKSKPEQARKETEGEPSPPGGFSRRV